MPETGNGRFLPIAIIVIFSSNTAEMVQEMIYVLVRRSGGSENYLYETEFSELCKKA